MDLKGGNHLNILLEAFFPYSFVYNIFFTSFQTAQTFASGESGRENFSNRLEGIGNYNVVAELAAGKNLILGYKYMELLPIY